MRPQNSSLFTVRKGLGVCNARVCAVCGGLRSGQHNHRLCTGALLAFVTPAGIEHVMLFQCDSLLVCPIFSLGYFVTTRARAQDLPEKSVTCGLCWWVSAAEGRIVAEKDWPGVLSLSPLLQFGLTLSFFFAMVYT